MAKAKAKTSGGNKKNRLHYNYALTGKLENINTGESSIHPKPYAKGGSVKGRK